MNDESFFLLKKDSIGTVYYRIQRKIDISREQKQKLIDKHVNTQMNKFLKDFSAGMIPDDQGGLNQDPGIQYANAREWAKKTIEDQLTGTDNKSLNVQIGQKDSYKKILEIESHPNFIGWDFPELIEDIKNSFND